MQYNKWEADGSICVQDSLSEVEPDLELELELEDAHDSRVVRESLSESDTMHTHPLAATVNLVGTSRHKACLKHYTSSMSCNA